MSQNKKQFIFDPNSQSYRYEPSLTGLDLKGKKYKAVFQECSKQIAEYFDSCAESRGKITRKEVLLISQQIGLPLKTTCEFLEYLGKLPTATWERKFAGMSVKDLMSLTLA